MHKLKNKFQPKNILYESGRKVKSCGQNLYIFYFQKVRFTLR